MIIIVDSGATKSDWRVIDASGAEKAQYRFQGINVSTMPLKDASSMIERQLAEVKAAFPSDVFKGFYFYVAGVVSDEVRSTLTETVLKIIPGADVEFQNDLIGAARSVCGHKPGIAAIMGTGSNSCFYDGETAKEKLKSGGFILGDDGSGAVLGKMFINKYFKNEVPEDVAKDFESKFDARYETIITNVYRGISPSGYLGTIAPFVVSHFDNPVMREMVITNFQNFIDHSLKQYDTDKYPVGIVGGFAWANGDLFKSLCEKSGIKVSRIIREPMTGLIEYHTGVLQE